MDDIERKYVQEVRDLLSSVDLKLLELLKTESIETFVKEEIIKKESQESKTFANWALPKTGEHIWFKMSNEEGKMRLCGNDGCDLFLKYNHDKETYEHWKLDANTGKAFFVNERCGGNYNATV